MTVNKVSPAKASRAMIRRTTVSVVILTCLLGTKPHHIARDTGAHGSSQEQRLANPSSQAPMGLKASALGTGPMVTTATDFLIDMHASPEGLRCQTPESFLF